MTFDFDELPESEPFDFDELPDLNDLVERDLWDSYRDAPDPDLYEQTEDSDA